MTLPESVPFADVEKALALLGITDMNATISVHIEPRRITVEEGRRNGDGKWLAAGDNLATVTTTIGIKR